MKKLSYLYLLGFTAITFCSCCQGFFDGSANKYQVSNEFGNKYGSYLAGRVAHLRKDFNNASKYYAKAFNEDKTNQDLLGQLYVILASQGQIDQAAQYAKKSLEAGDDNSFVSVIVAVDQIKQGKNKEAVETLKKSQGIVYTNLINPLLLSWNAVGAKDKDEALKQIGKLMVEPGFAALHNFHIAMIYDYFGDNVNAQKYYEIITDTQKNEVSFRSLQIISNFYLRTNQKEKATALLAQYSGTGSFSSMIDVLNENVQNSDNNVSSLITSASDGLSEALFSIAATLRQGGQNVDLAHIFISMSVYSNPKYDLAKLLLADILETRGLYEQANNTYASIDKSSEAYNVVLSKKAGNFLLLKDYKKAESLLKEILQKNPNNYQAYLDLGDVLRVQNKHKEAIKCYNDVLSKTSKLESQHWILLYALGVSYERTGQWNKAEESFLKALELSDNHYLVQNYLGYTWLTQKNRVEDAFGLIVEAYNQMPNDGNIADSLGYGFYKLGLYPKAIEYLEKATELEPNNPVISDHLGDAYWYGNRENEAIFQYNHALSMNDESGEFKPETVKAKIKQGLPENVEILSYDIKLINEKIKNINNY